MSQDKGGGSGGEMRVPGLMEYIAAGYPCLFLPTVEPEVAERRIRKALIDCEMGKYQFGVWKYTSGLLLGTPASPDLRKSTISPELIDTLVKVGESKEMMVVFHNVREFLKPASLGGMGNPGITQQLVDTILVARTKGSCLFFVGPHLDVPPELKSLITFVDCPLPTVDDIQSDYRKIVRAYDEEIKFPSGEKDLDVILRRAATAAVGLDSIGAENALSLSLATTGGIDIRVIQAQKEQEVRKSDVLEFISTSETMDEVGGFHALKEWVRKRQRVFTEDARKYGLSYPKGVLIVGPAGSGKSLVAKAIAQYLQLPLLRLDVGKIFRSLVGESEAAMRLSLQVAEAVAPVVLWIDEIDKALAGMQSSGNLDSGVTSRTIGTMLTWRQETRAPVFIVATANEVSNLPSMVYRKGRFDEVWATDLPDDDERKEIFEIHLKKRGRDPKKFDLKSLVRKSDSFVGSEIESCIEDAMFSSFDKKKEVDTESIEDALRETIPQSERDKEEIARIRQWVKTRARLVSGKNAGELTDRTIGFGAESRARAIKSRKGE